MNQREETSLVEAVQSIAQSLRGLLELKHLNLATKSDLEATEKRIIDHLGKLADVRSGATRITGKLDKATDSLAAAVAANQPPAGDSGSQRVN